jgi:hypothetical protein
MDCCFGISTVIEAKTVGNCAIFTEIHGLELDLIKFSTDRVMLGEWVEKNR